MRRTGYRQETITTGPIYIPVLNFIVPNNKLVITLKNPTRKRLSAFVTLGICTSPSVLAQPANGGGNSVYTQTYEMAETRIPLGWHLVDPMSCLRIERNFGAELLDSVIQVTATGDFKICPDSCQPICGKLEISSVVGFNFDLTVGAPPAALPGVPAEVTAALQAYNVFTGLLGSDPQTQVSYADWVLCEDTCRDESDYDSC